MMESLRKVDRDVEAIFDLAFKLALKALYAGNYDEFLGMTEQRIIPPNRVISFGFFQSAILKQAMEINPVTIVLNHPRGNFYDPESRVLAFGINGSAVKQVRTHAKNHINVVRVQFGDEMSTLYQRTLSAPKVKATIHHELAHYLDDTFNNSHIHSRLSNIRDKPQLRKRLQGGVGQMNASFVEIEGQIHNIFQMRKAYRSRWDKISFDEMLKLDDSIYFIAKGIKEKNAGEYAEWRRGLMERMAREGLLGAKMR